MHGTKALPGAVFWQSVPISIAAAAAYPVQQCQVKRDFKKDWRDFRLLKYCYVAHCKYNTTGFHEHMKHWCMWLDFPNPITSFLDCWGNTVVCITSMLQM